MDDVMFAFSAFVLGALHALEPGHGKTVVAAYLVGSKGRVRDAVALGGIVTFTHTFSIIILGLLTSIAAAYLVPETVHEVLEVVSGLLVVGVGLWMVYNRIISGKSAHGHSHDDYHSHDHHDHTPVMAAAASENGHDHSLHQHDQSLHQHDHEHNEEHDHLYKHEHAQAHVHEHHNDHGHHGHSHALPEGGRPSIGGLVTLGISGGIVPCPAALALLLAAVSVGNILGGVSLVVVFSLGLAAVLICIGVVLVKTTHLAGRYLSDKVGGDSQFARYAGIASAIVVTVLGLAMTVRAVIDVSEILPLG